MNMIHETQEEPRCMHQLENNQPPKDRSLIKHKYKHDIYIYKIKGKSSSQQQLYCNNCKSTPSTNKQANKQEQQRPAAFDNIFEQNKKKKIT